MFSSGLREYLSQAKRMPKVLFKDLLVNIVYPAEFPLTKEHFQRWDENPDKDFYFFPRLVHHIDEHARSALTKYYSEFLPRNARAHLDLCSSWVSHLPEEYTPERVIGLGLNKKELQENEKLTERVVWDLNHNPRLSFLGDSEIDVITNVVSVDYLTRPVELFEEMLRVLKPNGVAVMSFSNRRFPTKVINIWNSTNDYEHILIVASYFKFSGFEKITAMDISPTHGDPIYVVVGYKTEGQSDL